RRDWAASSPTSCSRRSSGSRWARRPPWPASPSSYRCWSNASSATDHPTSPARGSTCDACCSTATIPRWRDASSEQVDFVTVQIVTDGAASLPDALIREYDLTVVPMWLEIEGREVREDECDLEQVVEA